MCSKFHVINSTGSRVVEGESSKFIPFPSFPRLSLRENFDMPSELMKGFVEAFIIFDSKLFDSFSESQYFLDSYHTPSDTSSLMELEMVVGICHTSMRTYQQKSPPLVFLQPRFSVLKLVFMRKYDFKNVFITHTEIISVGMWTCGGSY